jgi:hypothetical protein
MDSFWDEHLGKHLVIIPWELANEMRKYTQVYYEYVLGWRKAGTIEWYRKYGYELWGRWNGHRFAVEVDDDKPEYTPDG